MTEQTAKSKEKEIEKVDEFQKKIDFHKKNGTSTLTITLENGQKCLVRKPGMREISIYQTGAMMLFAGEESEDTLLDASVKILQKCWLYGEFKIKESGNYLETEEILEAAFEFGKECKGKLTKVKKN